MFVFIIRSMRMLFTSISYISSPSTIRFSFSFSLPSNMRFIMACAYIHIGMGSIISHLSSSSAFKFNDCTCLRIIFGKLNFRRIRHTSLFKSCSSCRIKIWSMFNLC